MKRSYLYLAVGALALSACTSESVLEDAVVNRNAIGFQNVINKHSRVDDITTSGMENFYVFGYYTTSTDDTKAVGIFDDTKVSKDGSDWKYDGDTRYWLPGSNYRFFAYSCGTKDNTFQSGCGSAELALVPTVASMRLLKINDYVCDATNQCDLVYASSTGVNYAGIEGKVKDQNANVALTFNHILSKVQAQFTNKFPGDYKLEISNVKIQGIYNKGSYDEVAKWNNMSRESNNNVDLATETITATVKDAAKTEEAYVMPYVYNKEEKVEDVVEITFNLVVKNVYGDEVYAVAMTGKFCPKWEAGHAYKYNIDIDGEAAGLEEIVFDATVSVTDWDSDEEPVTIEVEWSQDAIVVEP